MDKLIGYLDKRWRQIIRNTCNKY